MKNLLEYIAEQSGMLYLSDLKGTDIWKGLVQEIEPGKYPKEEWNEAINYIYDVNISFHSAEEAKEYLLKNSLKQ